MKYTTAGPGDYETWGGLGKPHWRDNRPDAPRPPAECDECLCGELQWCRQCEKLVEVVKGPVTWFCPGCGDNDFEPCNTCNGAWLPGGGHIDD